LMLSDLRNYEGALLALMVLVGVLMWLRSRWRQR